MIRGLLFTTSLIVFTALGTPTRAQDFIPPGVDAWAVVPGGQLSFAITPIPAGFFEPGSQPFTGNVPICGAPLGPRGPFDPGSTDTVVQRKSTADLPGLPSVDPIPIELVELSLRSCAPIQVQTMTGMQPWMVQIAISPSRQAPDGQMQVNRLSPDGGTFDAQLPVRPLFTFVRQSDGAVRVLDDRNWPLVAPPIPWTTDDHSPPDRAVLPHASDGWCPGATPSGRQPWQLNAPGVTLRFELARRTLNPPLPSVDPSARVSPTAILMPGCQIGPGARIGAGALIGVNAVIGENARVGSECVVGGGATVAPGARVSPACIIGDGAQVGPGATMHRFTELGPLARLGAGSTMGGGATARGGCVIGQDVRVGGNARLGRNVSIGDGTAIAGRTILADDTHVAARRVADDWLICDPGTGIFLPLPIDQCEALDGAVRGTLLDTRIGIENPANFSVQRPPATSAAHATDFADIGQDLDDSGIPDREYVKDTYDCDDFAGDAEKALQDQGHDATFTVLWELNPDYGWWNALWTDKWINGHAVVDVHFPDGTTAWFEPQWRSTKPGWRLDMDFDGDGTVETADAPGDTPTDDGRRIEVYDSRAAAEAAGVVMD